MKKEMKSAKIPLLTEDELKELGEVLYKHKGNEVIKRNYWKEIYKKRV